MKKTQALIALLFTFLFTTQAFADPTLPAYDPQPVTYAVQGIGGAITPTIGDGSDVRGGTPPAVAIEPADVPSTFDADDWLEGPPGYTGFTPDAPDNDAKARFTCNWSHSGTMDPILAPGDKHFKHYHDFFGNPGTNESSTYQSLRANAEQGTCTGGPLNNTAYWLPTMIKEDAFGEGTYVGVKWDFATLYYPLGSAYSLDKMRLFRGLRYVWGFNPSDHGGVGGIEQHVQDEVDAANALPGNNSTYNYPDTGFSGWHCNGYNGTNEFSPNQGANASQPYLRDADGNVTLTCPAGYQLVARLIGPQCWDGVNLSAPDGRSHMRQVIGQSQNGNAPSCPEGWYYVIHPTIDFFYSHEGPEDYGKWFLSCDRMGEDQSHWTNPGQCFHTDWFGAWDYNDIMVTWMKHCTGLTIDGDAGVQHQCSDGVLGDGRKLRSDTISSAAQPMDGFDRYIPLIGWNPAEKHVMVHGTVIPE